jgi:hypothetical protein
LHINAYEAIFALAANLVVSLGATALLRALKVPDAPDATTPDDYVEPIPDGAAPLPATPGQEDRAGRFERPARAADRR